MWSGDELYLVVENNSQIEDFNSEIWLIRNVNVNYKNWNEMLQSKWNEITASKLTERKWNEKADLTKVIVLYSTFPCGSIIAVMCE